VKIRVFVLSTLLHTAVILFCLVLQLTAMADVDKRVTSGVALTLVCLAGVIKGARYARQAHGQYVAGAVVGGVFITMVGLWLIWALTFPVGEPVPLPQYLSNVLQKDANVLWLVAPTLAILVASLVGAEIAIRIRQMRSGNGVLGSRTA
jgi:hypothetical protein